MPSEPRSYLQYLSRWYVVLFGSLGLALVLLSLLFQQRDGAAQLMVQLAVVWAPLLLLWLLPGLVRRWRKAVLLLGSGLLCLLALWVAGPWIMERVALPQYDMSIDHRPRPTFGKFNEDGVQPDMPASAYRTGDFNIIFLGDSFTQGPTVPAHSTIPALAEVIIGRHAPAPMRVANFGWTPSGPVLQLRQLRQIGARYKPDLVVQLLDMSDFSDDIEHAALLQKHQGYVVAPTIFDYFGAGLGVVLGVDDPLGWLWRSSVFGGRAAAVMQERNQIPERQRFFHVSRPLSQSEPHLEVTWTALRRTHAEAARLGAAYALFILPRYQQFNRAEAPRDWEKKQWPRSDQHLLEPFKYFAKKTKGAPFPIHSLLGDFKNGGQHPLVWPDDPHYNLRGNGVAAKAIVRHLRADGLLPGNTEGTETINGGR